MAASTTPQTPSTAKKPEWAPRMWEGCNFPTWLGLLWRNRFAVQLPYLYIAVIITFVSLTHTILRIVQEAIFGRALRRVEIAEPPVFILGHWRTGTTLLHELFIRDPRFGFPTTYQCMDPNHFLLTEGIFNRWLHFLMPASRPMDNMKAGFDRPQEDEFALCMLGAGSSYQTISFPNHPPQCQEYLDLQGVPATALRRWKRTFKWFLKRVTYKVGKRLVLKSPPHTARLPVLKQMFPAAVFVHIVRDPFVVFPSTVNLWRTLYLTHGLQKPNFDGLDELVLSTFTRMYERLEEGKKLLDPRQFYEIRYEDLIKDPVGEMRKMYDHLGLGGFDEMLPHLQEYLASVKGYETNRYTLTDAQRAVVAERWGDVIRRYGYDSPR
jgi:hypothetical protein